VAKAQQRDHLVPLLGSTGELCGLPRRLHSSEEHSVIVKHTPQLDRRILWQ
jgi:hypothetical protein